MHGMKMYYKLQVQLHWTPNMNIAPYVWPRPRRLRPVVRGHYVMTVNWKTHFIIGYIYRISIIKSKKIKIPVLV